MSVHPYTKSFPISTKLGIWVVLAVSRCCLCKGDTFFIVEPLLRELHWLKVTEHIQFRLCVLAYRCLHGSAPQYLAETLHLTSDTEACRRLQSGSTSTLFVPATRRSSLGDRAFPVVAARSWNTLPVSLRTVSSYLTFRRELKTFLFNISCPDNWTVCVTL